MAPVSGAFATARSGSSNSLSSFSWLDNAKVCATESIKSAGLPGSLRKSIQRAFSRRLTSAGVPDQERCVEIWLAGEWKKLSAEESSEISRRSAEGESSFDLTSRGHVYNISLSQMTQTNVKTGRTRTMRFVDGNITSGLAMGFDIFRKAFHKYARNGVMSVATLLKSWNVHEGSPDQDAVMACVQSMMEDMKLTGQVGRVNLLEWNHFWALDRDSPSYQASKDLNVQLAKFMKEDQQVLGRMQMHFETAMGETGSGLSTAGLVKACQRLVDSQEKVIEKQWAVEVLERHGRGEVIWDDDAELNYFDFLSVMFGRKRYKVSLWMYDISEGMAKRWSWLFLGRQFEGIWHTGVVVEYPGKPAEFWFGGNLFISVPGTTPFGSPTKKVHLGFTYKTREEVRNHMARHLASTFTRSRYDVLNHNCNHFSERLCLFLLNELIPDEVALQPQMVMSSLVARTIRPLLNRWLGGFGDVESASSSAATDGEQATSKIVWSEVQRGAVVEFCTVEGGRPTFGVVTASNCESCTVRGMDFWSSCSVSWRVPSSLVLKVVECAPARCCGEDAIAGLDSAKLAGAAVSAGCSWPPLPCLLGQRPANQPCGRVAKRSALRVDPV